MNFRGFFIANRWWGKLIGAFFGFLIAGSVGALFGLLVGNFFDQGLSSYFANPHWFYHHEKREIIQKIFFEATFSIMGHLAKADGRVTEQELNMALLLMDEMHLNKIQKTRAKQLFNQGKQLHFNLHEEVIKLQQACKDNRELLRLFIDIQYRSAQVDGLNSKKIKVLDTIFTTLGFAPFHKQSRFYEHFGTSYTDDYQEARKQQSSNKQQTYQPRTTTLDQAYALLDLSNQASKQEVKKAYRRLLSRNHPDKLIAQGLPQEMIKIANEKTQRIVKAYELICTSKGW